MPAGDFLVKWELVAELDKLLNTGDLSVGATIDGEATRSLGSLASRTQIETTLAIEVTKGLLIDAPENLIFPVDAPAGALRVSRTFLRETLRMPPQPAWNNRAIRLAGSS